MEAQLDFTWHQDPVVWNPAPAKYIKEERYELPQQLDFRLADLPSIPSEQPVPMSFTNGGKKLVQFKGQTKPKQKSQSFSKPKPVLSKKPKTFQKPVARQASKPEWNSQIASVGLFDPTISKKVPIDIQHALKKDPSIPKKPQFYQDLQGIPGKKTQVGVSKSAKSVKIEENLDVKFIADQEDIVKNLEKQLERERIARKKLDDQFAEKMKEMEKVNKKIKGFEQAASKVETVKRSNISRSPEKPKPLNSVPTQKEHKPTGPGLLSKPQNFSTFNPKSGFIYEEPTHDIGPTVLKAPKISQGIMAQIQDLPQRMNTNSKPPTKIDTSGHSELIEKPYPMTLNTETVIEPRLKTQSVQFQSFEIAESDPVLNSISAAMVRYKAANQYNNKASSALISQVGAKYIAYYANELTDMLIDDFLEDTVYDLQRIEEKKHQMAHFDFTKEAETHFQTIVKDFEQETRTMQAKHLTVKKGFSKEDEVLKRIMEDDNSEEIFFEDPRREWNIELGDSEVARIRRYKKEFEDFQRVFSGGSDGKLWDVYAIIGDDLIEELFKEVTKEYDDTLDEFTERFMTNEFT